MDTEEYLLVPYKASGENLFAILAGLDIQPWDTVLSILASDQPFAFLNVDNVKVEAVDTVERQVQYFEYRKQLLKEGKKACFLALGSLSKLDVKLVENGYHDDSITITAVDAALDKQRRDFFLNNGTLDRITKNLGNVTHRHGDVFDTPDIERFSKVYLSNGLSSNVDFTGFAQKLSPGTLVYLASQEFLHSHAGFEKFLKQDKELTAKAQALESRIVWNPGVYRRLVEPAF